MGNYRKNCETSKINKQIVEQKKEKTKDWYIKNCGLDGK